MKDESGIFDSSFIPHPSSFLLAARNLALRARGLARSSSSPAVTGFFVNTSHSSGRGTPASPAGPPANES